MAFEYPDELKYLDSHEYARLLEEDGNEVAVGITAFAIDQLGDVVFLELPEEGDTVTKGETFGSVESVKAVEDLKAPLSGEVIARNDALMENPEQIGDDPYGDGWLIKVKADNLDDDLEDAMTAEEYKEQAEGG